MKHNDLESRKAALIAEIHRAFEDVKLVGGISWRQAEAADMGPYPEDRKWASPKDKDHPWSTLVEDRKWNPFPGVGGFAFMDARGFRYYLAPTMIRMLSLNEEWGRGHFVGVISGFVGHQPAPLLTDAQCGCIARFMQLMSDIEAEIQQKWALENPWHPVRHEKEHWQTALDSFWSRYLPAP